MIQAAGDTFTYATGSLEGTELPLLGELDTASYVRSKSREDSTFVEYLHEVGASDLLSTTEFRLSDVGRTDSLLAEIAKYDRAYVEPPGSVRRHVHSALLHVCRTWSYLSLAHPSTSVLRLLSPEEALGTMDGSKSPGYPWRKFAPSKDMLMAIPECTSQVWSRVGAIWRALRSRSLQIESLWYSFLKEELRPLEKLDRSIPAVRSISGAPVDLAIVGNQLSHDFNEALYAFHCEPAFGSVVGMSPFHGGWDQLARMHWLDPRFPRQNSASIDVTQWDRSFSPYLFTLVVQVRRAICMYHGDSGMVSAAEVLERLYDEVSTSAVVVPLRRACKVVMLAAGMKSGWVNTTTDNTLGHMIVLISYMFHVGIADQIGKGVLFSLYGDDNLISWSDELAGYFEGTRLEEWYRSWGFETHGIVVVRGSARFDQVFLGGRFHVCPVTGTYVYHPESGQKAIDSVRYKYRDHDTSFQRVCSLRVLHYYNAETFALLDGYAKYLVKEQLVSHDLLPNYLDGPSIVALHTGRESSDGCLFPPHLTTDIDSDFPWALHQAHRLE